MVGFNYSGQELVTERRMVIEECAKIAEAVAAETSDGDGEFYIAREIADRIRALNGPATLLKE